jgi:hypothetical protein
VYPDIAPVGPTPDPDASPEPTPIANRTPILRGYFKSPVSFTLASLDSFRFTVPSDEVDKTRGFTIALFAVPDKNAVAQSLLGSHKDPATRLAFTTDAVVEANSNGIHSGTKNDPIQIYAGTGYAVILYGDPRAVAAPAVAAPGALRIGAPGQPQPGQQGAAGVPAAPGAYNAQGAPTALPFYQTPPPAGVYPQATAPPYYNTPPAYQTPTH